MVRFRIVFYSERYLFGLHSVLSIWLASIRCRKLIRITTRKWPVCTLAMKVRLGFSILLIIMPMVRLMVGPVAYGSYPAHALFRDSLLIVAWVCTLDQDRLTKHHKRYYQHY